MASTTARNVAREVRVELLRHGRTTADLALAIGRSRQSVSRRLNGHVPFTADELVAVAEWLDVPLSGLVAAAETEPHAAWRSASAP